MDAPATPIVASADVAARLKTLTSTLRDLGWTARFVAPPARQPFLFIQNPESGLQMLHEYIHASPEDGSYWWSWAEPIAADAGGKLASTQLWSFLELGALAGAVPCTRLHTRQVLWEWGLAELAETAELVVSEIVTNAVQASNEPDGRPRADAPVIRVWLSTDDLQHVLIQVWDAIQRVPERQDAGADSEHGRGLLLVDALSARWGAYRSAGNGKVVWAMVKL